MINSQNEKTIQSVERALNILEQFSITHKELNLSELSLRTGLKKTTCFGLLKTLQSRNYLTYNSETNKYRLGINTFLLGSVYEQNIEIVEIAKPYIESLSQKYNLIAHLVKLDDMDMIYVTKVGEKASFRIRSSVGSKATRYGSAVSKIAMAHILETQGSDIFDESFVAHTTHTIVDKSLYLEELNKVKTLGIAHDREELDYGLHCIASPIYDHKKHLIGAISISGNIDTVNPAEDEIISDLKQITKQISNQIGFN